MRRAVGIALQRDGGDTDGRASGEPFLQFVILRLACGQTEPPTVIADDDVDMVRVVEGRRAALERGVVELPFGGSELPNELGKFAPVLFVTGPAAVCGEIEPVPCREGREDARRTGAAV